MGQGHPPGVFGEVQPLLERLLGGGLVEDFDVPVPGEVIMIAAAIFAGAGHMNIAPVIPVAAPGAIIGDNHGGKIDVVARFIEGLRQVNDILAGSVGMAGPRFLGFNALGAVLWVCWWSLLGYLAGENISEIYDGFERYKWYVIGAAAVLIVGYVVHRVRQRTSARKKS